MSEQKKTGRPLLRGDVLLIAALLLLSAIGMLYLFVLRESGDVVKVTVDGELYGVYSLSVDITEEIPSREGYNRLVIRDGRAYVESASCPDGICISHRPIFRSGESIVCLPNRVVVTVFTDDAADAPDIVA